MDKKITLAYAVLSFLLNIQPATAQQIQKQHTASLAQQQDFTKESTFLMVRGDDQIWNIEIAPTTIRFKSTDIAESFNVAYVSPVVSADGKTKTYKSASDQYEIEIVITDEKCTDRVLELAEFCTNIKYRKIGEETFTLRSGCAIAVLDNRLNFVWKLHEVYGQLVTPEDFGMELPYLDLHVRKFVFSGFGGCNRIKGNLVMKEGTGLLFSDMVISKMTCIEGNKENLVIEALRNTVYYEIRGNRLYLLKDDVVQAVFVKAT